MYYTYDIPDEKIESTIIYGKDLEIIDPGFFKRNPQVDTAYLDFNETVDDISSIIPALSNVSELSLEGFSPIYYINVNMCGLKFVRALTLINCAIDKSLNELHSLESLSICNCRSKDLRLDKLELLELHDLSDDPRDLSRDGISIVVVNPRYINYTKLRALTIQYTSHVPTYQYSKKLQLIKIINSYGANVIISCSQYTEVIIT
jgi:hypothetical protein